MINGDSHFQTAFYNGKQTPYVKGFSMHLTQKPAAFYHFGQ
jgi:hypothetical protein